MTLDWREFGMNKWSLPGPVDGRVVPVRVGVSGWEHVAVGDAHTCGIQTDGSLWCWGLNIEGQAGVGGSIFPFSVVPSRVGSGNDCVGVSAGAQTTCATRSDESAWCWGFNRSGQLGDGGAWKTEPTEVK